MSHIQQEIAEQPDVMRRLIEEGAANVAALAKSIRAFDPAFVLIAARGTSDNAGRYAQYLLGTHARLPVALAAPSLHTLYEAPPKLSRTLVIGISQSGKSEDVRQVLQDGHDQGALTMSITNDDESPLAHAAHFHLPLHAGEEISVAATKTYTAELTAVALLAAALADQSEYHKALARVPDWAAETLKNTDSIAGWTGDYKDIDRFVSVGRGYNYCTAFEISLKIKELCYITGAEYSEADFRHGPMTLLQKGSPLIALAPQGKTLPGMVSLLEQARERGADSLVISNDEGALALAKHALPLPALPEWLSPIVAVIPGQVFAMNLALAKGHSVDRPFGLTKVTITR